MLRCVSLTWGPFASLIHLLGLAAMMHLCPMTNDIKLWPFRLTYTQHTNSYNLDQELQNTARPPGAALDNIVVFVALANRHCRLGGCSVVSNRAGTDRIGTDRAGTDTVGTDSRHRQSRHGQSRHRQSAQRVGTDTVGTDSRHRQSRHRQTHIQTQNHNHILHRCHQ